MDIRTEPETTSEQLRATVERAWNHGLGSTSGVAAYESLLAVYGLTPDSPFVNSRGQITGAGTSLAVTRTADVNQVADRLTRFADLHTRAFNRPPFITISEHTLARDGMWGMTVTPTGEATLTLDRLHNRTVVMRGTVTEVVTRVVRDHWYEPGEP